MFGQSCVHYNVTNDQAIINTIINVLSKFLQMLEKIF